MLNLKHLGIEKQNIKSRGWIQDYLDAQTEKPEMYQK